MGPEAARVGGLRDRLEAGILRTVTGAIVNGAREDRVPNTTNISFDRVEAESLLIALDLEGVAVSTGSACSSGTLEPSHVCGRWAFRRIGRRTRSGSAWACFRPTPKSTTWSPSCRRSSEKLRSLTRKPVSASF
jgi:hypothetical protein